MKKGSIFALVAIAMLCTTPVFAAGQEGGTQKAVIKLKAGDVKVNNQGALTETKIATASNKGKSQDANINVETKNINVNNAGALSKTHIGVAENQ